MLIKSQKSDFICTSNLFSLYYVNIFPSFLLYIIKIEIKAFLSNALVRKTTQNQEIIN